MIAHLPAGYLVTRLLPPAPWRMTAGLLGSVAPDLDMLWWLATGGHTHHHAYVTHFPSVWLLGLLGSALARSPMGLAFTLNGLVHMALDTVVGDIAWLAPLDHRRMSLMVVTDRYDPWWLNFVLHGSFALELALVAAALWAWRRDRYAGGSNQR